MKVWYLDHSAAAVKTENHLLLFDLFDGVLHPQVGKGLEEGFISPKQLKGENILVFISHEHEDHFHPDVFKLKQQGLSVRYVLPEELDALYGGGKEDVFMESGQTQKCRDFTVTAFESTDIGLAYLIEVDGKLIYHGGDLNCWNWKGEDEFNLDQEKRYEEQMNCLKKVLNGRAVDLAFAAADPRMDEEHRFCGIRSLMEHADIKALVPIHLWGDFSVCSQLRELAKKEHAFQKAVYFSKRGRIRFPQEIDETGGSKQCS